MKNAALSTFIIDLKLTPEGAVKILEFGRAWNYSGFAGHDRLCEQQALRDKIGPYYGRFGIPFIQLGYEDKEFFPKAAPHMVVPGSTLDLIHSNYLGLYRAIRDQIKTTRVPNLYRAEHHSMVVLTDAPHFGQNLAFIRAINQDFSPPLVVDSHPLMYGCMQNKAILHFAAAAHAPELFPETRLLPYARNKAPDWDEIGLSAPQWANGAVIKMPESNCGRDVQIVPAQTDMKGALNQAFNEIGPTKGNPLLVVQEPVRGRLVKRPGWKKPMYDPTIRVAVSALYQGGEVAIECHDVAYNKFPADPADPQAITNKTAKSDSKNPSSLLDDDEKELVFAQLREGLPKALTPVFSGSARSALAAPGVSRRLLPFMALTLMGDSAYCETDELGAIANEHGEPIAEAMRELAIV